MGSPFRRVNACPKARLPLPAAHGPRGSVSAFTLSADRSMLRSEGFGHRFGFGSARLAALCTAIVLYAGAPAAHADLWGHTDTPAAVIPPASEAFRLLPLLPVAPKAPGDPPQHTRYRIEWDIAPGYYLYRERIKVTETNAAGTLQKVNVELPIGTAHHDDHFGDVHIFRGDVAGSALPSTSAKQLKIQFQGCADQGICYPPKEVILDLPPTATLSSRAEQPNSAR